MTFVDRSNGAFLRACEKFIAFRFDHALRLVCRFSFLISPHFVLPIIAPCGAGRYSRGLGLGRHPSRTGIPRLRRPAGGDRTGRSAVPSLLGLRQQALPLRRLALSGGRDARTRRRTGRPAGWPAIGPGDARCRRRPSVSGKTKIPLQAAATGFSHAVERGYSSAAAASVPAGSSMSGSSSVSGTLS